MVRSDNKLNLALRVESDFRAKHFAFQVVFGQVTRTGSTQFGLRNVVQTLLRTECIYSNLNLRERHTHTTATVIGHNIKLIDITFKSLSTGLKLRQQLQHSRLSRSVQKFKHCEKRSRT